MNSDKKIEHISNWIKQYILSLKFTSPSLIIGVSGGIDSAVIAYLWHNAIKEKTLALIMPDSKISPDSETSDAIKIIDELGENKVTQLSLLSSASNN